MTPRRRRMLAVALIVGGVAIAVGLALRALNENMLYFYTPQQVLAGEAPGERMFRLGGLVTQGSVEREPGSLRVQFTLTDTRESVPVQYEGLLPDLFREGQGIIAHGVLGDDGIFRAEEVLAKHDENYMAPEVAQALREAGHPVDAGAGDGT